VCTATPRCMRAVCVAAAEFCMHAL
jgi:hypothetical protein